MDDALLHALTFVASCLYPVLQVDCKLLSQRAIRLLIDAFIRICIFIVLLFAVAAIGSLGVPP